ncbi:hypothetical protein Bpfe_007622, partial [Biomphalaria pfeifferi]
MCIAGIKIAVMKKRKTKRKIVWYWKNLAQHSCRHARLIYRQVIGKRVLDTLCPVVRSVDEKPE